MKLKKVLSLIMVACLMVSLAACGSSGSSESSAESSGLEAASSEQSTESEATEATAENTASSGFTVEIGPNTETIDPNLNTTVDGANMVLMAFECLLIEDENGQLQPGQAESYEVSDDGLTWTFTMRDGLKWSDGSDLDASDFEYTFKRLANPDTAAPYADTVTSMIDGFDEAMGNPDADGNPTTDPNPDALNVTASEDGKTLTIVLSYPCTYFDRICAYSPTAPVQQETVEANGDAWATDPSTFISNGPYMITEWIPSERIVMTKNPYYVGGWDSDRIVSDTITFLLLEDATAAYAAYNSGEAQLVKDVPTDEIPSLTRAEDGGDFYVDPIMGTYYININQNVEALQDERVRRALMISIDRDYIANTIMQGTYSPAYNFVGLGVTDDNGAFQDGANGGEPYISEDYEANVEEAKSLLAEAGYPDGEGLPAFTYSTNDAGYHIAVAEYLQQAWGELGITLNIERVEWSAFTSLRRAGDYDLARNGWSMAYDDASNILELFYTTNGNNDSQYSNSDFDAAIDASRVADKAEHFAALHEAEDILMEDAATIPVAYYNDYWLQDSSLQGTWHSASGYWYLMYGYVE